MLPCANYYRPEILADELDTLFDPLWQFGALAGELAADRDFVCVDYKNTATVLQNFRGEIRAFANVCSHRFNRIQPGERGNRPLMCAYHGWSFDSTGFPHGMPRRGGFALDDRERLCLTGYEVETCGIFVFFRKRSGGPSLREYLGAFYPLLEQIGSYFGPEIDAGTISHAANWKLLVENVLECYHCSVVHQDTFVKTLGIGRAGIEQERFDGPHSSSHFPRTATAGEARRQKALAYLDTRAFTHDSFFHIHIFPNLFISSTQGLSFYVGHALPLSATETGLRFRLFEPKLDLTRAQRAAQDLINQSGKALGRAVIDEDRAILENVQRGVELSEKPGVIGRDEIRIAAFMRAYTHLMGGGSLGGIPSIDDHVAAGDPARSIAE
ncbi:aromatic ring-hydroxylating oxygenase subunit alpha [Methylorubrum extorquens]|uniref:Rieske (2Fe-2S) domain protein n=1 Tax=Methylorubrum extorquens (strain CM4 / NCIMB 13688) TaxID=440085 RepID=B7KRD7_METC4|nr:SRPBCC family protein [Methylorubrum extorquens]ACK83873.1 Rieske (2Fe-2S) domain protein [Methylorubrum extorquens CM4]